MLTLEEPGVSNLLAITERGKSLQTDINASKLFASRQWRRFALTREGGKPLTRTGTANANGL